MRTTTLLLMLALLAACGPKPQENEPCEKSPSSLVSGEEGDCDQGLVCLISDDCPNDATCPGVCRKHCNSDADCRAGTTCSGEITPENGGGKFCEAPR